MAKKQKRRTISVRGDTYERVREHCATNHVHSMSDYLEVLIARDLGVERPARFSPIRQRAVEAPPAPPLRKMSVQVKPSPPELDFRNPPRPPPPPAPRHPAPAIPAGTDDPARSGRIPAPAEASKAPARAISDPWGLR